MPIPDPNADEYGGMTPWPTVADVIERLRIIAAANPDMPVRVEGCDCLGDAGKVSLDAGSVLIERTEYVYADEDGES